MTAWPASASLGWLSDPAGAATLKGRLAGFARRARGPGRCNADKLRGLLLPAGFSNGPAHLTRADVTTAGPLAQSFLPVNTPRAARLEGKSNGPRVSVPVSDPTALHPSPSHDSYSEACPRCRAACVPVHRACGLRVRFKLA